MDESDESDRSDKSGWLERALGLAAAVGSGGLIAAAFPPHGVPEAAYVAFLPLMMWLYRRPPWRLVAAAGWLAGTGAWLYLIFWLRHVTAVGMVALAATLGLFVAAWALAARWVWPRAEGAPFHERAIALLGLAGLWIVFEWVRGWLFTGFPWFPLAASQVPRPALLQVLPWTGALGLSAVLVAANLGLATYLRQVIRRPPGRRWWQRLCPDFHLGFGLVLLCFGISAMPGIYPREREVLAAVALLQPDVPQPLKWDPSYEVEIRRVLANFTLYAAAQGADIVAWPEAVTSFPTRGHPASLETRGWIEKQARDNGLTVLFGSLAVESPAPGEARWFNTIEVAHVQDGLGSVYYAQRHLVPFGQYVPLARFLPWISTFVPIDGAFTPAAETRTVGLRVRDYDLRVGGLICYEDAYSRLARANVRAGADLHYVPTNNAWFGTEGGAEQHAAHSVLRAVETRRPVVRVGNAGWSGIIDEFGYVHTALLDPERGPYFRGLTTGLLTRDASWAGRWTFYVRYGDWILAVGALLALAAWLIFRNRSEAPPSLTPEPEPESHLAGRQPRRSFARRRFEGRSGG